MKKTFIGNFSSKVLKNAIKRRVRVSGKSFLTDEREAANCIFTDSLVYAKESVENTNAQVLIIGYSYEEKHDILKFAGSFPERVVVIEPGGNLPDWV